MSGTKIGGKKAAYTNRERHGLDFYARIGAKGGRNGHTGGFAANPELARIAGRKGGLKSRRGKSKETLRKEEILKQFENVDLEVIKQYTTLSNKDKKNLYIRKGNEFIPIHSGLEPEPEEL